MPSLRVLPLGDSITEGYQSSETAGYRGPLWTLLTDAGYAVEYVGSQGGSLPTHPGVDLRHEGHGGWYIMGERGVYERLNDWFSRYDTPDVILLHIGTNSSADLTDPSRMTSLLDRLYAEQPGANVIATTVLWRGDGPSNYPRIEKFNAALPNVVAAQRAKGQDICLLDMESKLGDDHANFHADLLHPNATGYGLMAQAWFEQIRELYPTPESVVHVRTPAAFPVSAAYEDGRLVLDVGFNQVMDAAQLANPAHWVLSADIGSPAIFPVYGGRRARVLFPWAKAAVPARDMTLTVKTMPTADGAALLTAEVTFAVPAYTPLPDNPPVDVPDPETVTCVRAVVSRDRRQICVEFGENAAAASLVATAWKLEGTDRAVVTARRSPFDPREAILALSGELPSGDGLVLKGTWTLVGQPVAVSLPVRAETAMGLPSEVLSAVPEASGYRVVKYVAAPHPLARPWGTLDADYTLDETRFARFDFARAAFLVEVATAAGTRWVWTSMDAYTDDAAKLGPASLRRQNEFVTYVGHLLVAAGATGAETVPDVVQGAFAGGNLEMVWSGYTQGNASAVVGADGSVYDCGDSCKTGLAVNWGCFSVNDYLHGRTAFNISHFGTGNKLSWGLGNQPTGNPDWTINDNAADFTSRRLWVLVRETGALSDKGVLLMGF